MTDEAKIAHLVKLCCSDRYRISLTAPFLVTFDDESWSMASDGKMLFAWRGALPGIEARREAPKVPREWVDKAMAASRPIAVGALREWAGAPVFPSMQDCSSCKGTGKATEHHTCNCEYCEADETFTVDCFDCDGEKKVMTEDLRHGVIGHAVVNRNYFAMLLEGIEGEAFVDPGVDRFDQILMRGDDWIAIVMPRDRERDEREKVETAPVLAV